MNYHQAEFELNKRILNNRLIRDTTFIIPVNEVEKETFLEHLRICKSNNLYLDYKDVVNFVSERKINTTGSFIIETIDLSSLKPLRKATVEKILHAQNIFQAIGSFKVKVTLNGERVVKGTAKSKIEEEVLCTTDNKIYRIFTEYCISDNVGNETVVEASDIIKVEQVIIG